MTFGSSSNAQSASTRIWFLGGYYNKIQELDDISKVRTPVVCVRPTDIDHEQVFKWTHLFSIGCYGQQQQFLSITTTGLSSESTDAVRSRLNSIHESDRHFWNVADSLRTKETESSPNQVCLEPID